MSNSQYPSAKEAKQIAFEAKEAIFAKEQKALIDEIFTKIKDEANQGKTTLSVYAYDAVNFDRLDIGSILRERGYRVEKMLSRTGSISISFFFVISWE